MHTRVPLAELNFRIMRFREQMNQSNPGWEVAAIFSKINQYYFTGTMQDGVLFIHRNDESVFWVRRSYERAVEESEFPVIKPMVTYREPAAVMQNLTCPIYLEKEIIPIAMLERFLRYFRFKGVESADAQISRVRAVKSEYELSLMRQSGQIHRKVMEELVPGMLHEGMSELEFFCDLFTAFIKEGHQGIVRWGMFGAESILGHAAFGVSSLYPTAMNSPSGNYGMSPAVPMNGNPDRRLRKGDLIYIDTGCGVGGYHTDKTMTYMFGRSIPDAAIEAHQHCVDIMNKVASMLRPGAVPSAIYNEVISSLSPAFLENFMGYGKRTVKFIGHGIGLTIDETPVIANGFNEPISEGMVFAVEPKKGIPDIGLVGTENTYIVTPQGGISITGDNPGLIPVW
ncbi:MAG: aminopeptidase P family protein [Bacteroidales bacterium]|nr:aminopeptidase P family protein [Bacteroidales bacterium]